MNEEYQKIDTDELISLYIDGQASERQVTELKRLMLHDSSIGERINALRRQQQVLGALPVEAAPASLAEDIRAAIERKLVTADSAVRSQAVLANSRLFARRLMAVAAMFLLPLGVLALVVFQIMKPAVEGPADYIANRDFMEDNPTVAAPSGEETGIPDTLPFKGTLVLRTRTDEYMTVSSAVKETVEKMDLLEQTFPDRTADTVRFQITASPGQIAALVDALAVTRPQCRQVLLQVQEGDFEDQMIEIPNIENEQLKILVYEDSPAMFARLASRYALANRNVDPLFEQKPKPDGYPEPSIPTLAGSYDTANRTVQLTIQIERAVEE
jgi:hypothetical protein